MSPKLTHFSLAVLTSAFVTHETFFFYSIKSCSLKQGKFNITLGRPARVCLVQVTAENTVDP